ncbi:MAG: Crp/Fnr family transcriptional regulator [Rhodobacter sp.]|nr:Crp/Fnr family transcriptional regulator [Rhodobacter sp.]
MPVDLKRCRCCGQMRGGLCGHIYNRSPEGFRSFVQSHDLKRHQTLGPTLPCGRHLAILANGRAKLSSLAASGEDRLIEFVSTGDIGELQNDRRGAVFATALERARICVLSEDLADTMSRDSAFLRSLSDQRAREVARSRMRIRLLCIAESTDRLAAFLLTQLRKVAIPDTRRRIDLPYSREDIGFYLNLSPGTVSRSFSALKTAGMIDTHSPTKISCIPHAHWTTILTHVHS